MLFGEKIPFDRIIKRLREYEHDLNETIKTKWILHIDGSENYRLLYLESPVALHVWHRAFAVPKNRAQNIF